MATRVKTEAATDIPCTKPLILHTVFEKGQPEEKKEETWTNATLTLKKIQFCLIQVAIRSVKRQKVEAGVPTHDTSRR